MRDARTLILFLLLYIYTLPFTLPMLGSYFSQDHIFNLLLYLKKPLWQTLSSNVFFWTTYHRPLGGLLYVFLYRVFGMNPFPYYLAAFLIFTLNLALAFSLLIRLTGNRVVAFLALALASIHYELVDIWYNFGAVFDLLAFGLTMASFHLYISFVQSGGPRRRHFYVGSLVLYVLAINSKEAAVALPAILATYELVYRVQPSQLARAIDGVARRLGAFFAVAAIYTVGKIVSAQATWRAHPDYRYRLDSSLYDNLQAYFQRIFLYNFDFDGATLAWVLLLSLALAVILRNRQLLFGWFYFLIALSPVLGLPRPWGLYLYLPLVGLALYLAEMLVVLVRAARRAGESVFPVARSAPWVAWASLPLVLVALAVLQRDPFWETAQRRFVKPGAERAAFTRQLFAMYPEMPDRSALLILRSPFPNWTLQFTIWLHYRKPAITVLSGPDLNIEDFPALGRQVSEYHVFDYQDGKLVEIERNRLAAVP